jgi:hypothetical protein
MLGLSESASGQLVCSQVWVQDRSGEQVIAGRPGQADRSAKGVSGLSSDKAHNSVKASAKASAPSDCCICDTEFSNPVFDTGSQSLAAWSANSRSVVWTAKMRTKEEQFV